MQGRSLRRESSPAQRSTRQLEAVLHALLQSTDHPTADQLFRRVQAALPRVGRGTVYRNLQKLVQADRVRVVPVTGRCARYDGRTDPHDHFVCAECGLVVDVEVEERRSRLTRRSVDGHRVDALALSYVGRCKECEVRTPDAQR
jgi:Fur family peroxide stress response transcriptional regulator